MAAGKDGVKRKRGRPETYTRAHIDRIFELIAAGDSMIAAARKVGMSSNAAEEWIARHGLKTEYARAREQRGEALAEECLTIVDNATRDTWQQDRLRYDARKWFASKLYPKVYGDKVTQEVVGADGGPLKLASVDLRGLSDEDLATIERILSRAANKDVEV